MPVVRRRLSCAAARAGARHLCHRRRRRLRPDPTARRRRLAGRCGRARRGRRRIGRRRPLFAEGAGARTIHAESGARGLRADLARARARRGELSAARRPHDDAGFARTTRYSASRRRARRTGRSARGCADRQDERRPRSGSRRRWTRTGGRTRSAVSEPRIAGRRCQHRARGGWEWRE